MCGRNQRGRSKFDVAAHSKQLPVETMIDDIGCFVYDISRATQTFCSSSSPIGRRRGHICLKLITKQNASFVTKYSNKKSKLIAIEFVPPLRPKDCRCSALFCSVGSAGIQQMRHTYTTPLTQREHSQSIKIPSAKVLRFVTGRRVSCRVSSAGTKMKIAQRFSE